MSVYNLTIYTADNRNLGDHQIEGADQAAALSRARALTAGTKGAAKLTLEGPSNTAADAWHAEAVAGPFYLVEVRGANGCAARIGRFSEQIFAHTSGETGWCPAEVYPHDLPDSATSRELDSHPRAPYWTAKGVETRRVALFTSARAAEMAVADGELWNGQQYRVRAARGEQLREGIVIDSYQAPHRPRRDPAAARVNRTLRAHPDSWARLDAEAKRTGEGAGQVFDRLTKMLDS